MKKSKSLHHLSHLDYTGNASNCRENAVGNLNSTTALRGVCHCFNSLNCSCYSYSWSSSPMAVPINSNKRERNNIVTLDIEVLRNKLKASSYLINCTSDAIGSLNDISNTMYTDSTRLKRRAQCNRFRDINLGTCDSLDPTRSLRVLLLENDVSIISSIQERLSKYNVSVTVSKIADETCTLLTNMVETFDVAMIATDLNYTVIYIV